MNTAYAHQNTLHHDIVERRQQMRLTLASLRRVARTATCVRAHAIDESLATLQTHLSAAGDANNSAEAAALTYWLDRSRYLYDVPSPTLASEHDGRRLQLSSTISQEASK